MGIFNFLKSNSEHRKSIRVSTNIGDKFINVKLGQTYESMDILSLKIFQKDLYRLFDAEYGIIVGRVLGQGVGIPNAKVSVFIPIDEEDITNPTTLDDIKKIEAAALYPFESVFDKDGNGKVYNLLPKYGRNRNFNGFPDNNYGIGATPKTPVGTFPEKDEILVNETVAYVYDKYLKYTTVTNESGDYILTVPANKSYNVNMSCDITDIGRFSTCAALLKLEGYPDNYFSEDGRTLNDEIPLERLPNIDIQNNSITVKPLWSQNTDNANVGINRLDFNLIKKIKPFATVFGNYFTQNNGTWWGDRIIFRLFFGLRNLCIGCPDNVRLRDDSNFGFAFKIRLCIDTSILDWSTTIGFSTGLDPEPGVDCNSVVLCIQIRNILPFFKVAGVLVNKYCKLNGGRNDYSPFAFINLGATNQCSINDALSVLDGLTDDLFIQSHQKGNIDLRVFNIKNSVPEEDAQILNEEAQSIANDDSIFDNYSYRNDIQLFPKDKYIFYQNNGSFITLINCDRNKVITNENGDLIPISDTSEKGVFTSFRGYFYITNDAPIDNPPTRNRTGKIAFKIPQFFDYGDYKVSTSNFNKWVWKHFKFDYGKIYSVAQYNDVRYNYMPSKDEQTEGALLDFNAVQGFDEQTNILFLGTFEEEQEFTQPMTNYLRDFNIGETLYQDFYNHITVLGIDDDNIFSLPTSADSQNYNSGQPPQSSKKPIGIATYRFGETNIINQNIIDGWNMFDNNPTYGIAPMKARINLILPSGYSNSVPPDNDKWSFGIRAVSEEQKNLMNSNDTPFYGTNQDFLFNIDNLAPSYQFVSGTDGVIFKFFDIIIYNPYYFYRYHELLVNIGAGDSQTWWLETVLSNGYDDSSYKRVLISTINRTNNTQNYIFKPY